MGNRSGAKNRAGETPIASIYPCRTVNGLHDCSWPADDPHDLLIFITIVLHRAVLRILCDTGPVGFSPTEEDTRNDRLSCPPTVRFHADRVAGGNRHHRDPDRAAPPRRPEGP